MKTTSDERIKTADLRVIPCNCGMPVCKKVFIQPICYGDDGRLTRGEASRIMQGLKMLEHKIHDVARAFCLRLRAEIGDKDVDRAAELNAAEENGNICHTHDYCDANMVMDAALAECGVSVNWDSEEGMPQEVSDLFNDAWFAAKEAGFRAEKVPV